MDALKACCKLPITHVDPDTYGTCYSNCKTSGLEQALEVSWCLGNYTQKHSEYYYGSLGCETTVSGATMLGRTRSWGGVGDVESCGLGGGDDDVGARMARMWQPRQFCCNAGWTRANDYVKTVLITVLKGNAQVSIVRRVETSRGDAPYNYNFGHYRIHF